MRKTALPITKLELFEWTESVALDMQEAGVSRLVYHKDTTSEESIIFVKEFFGYLNLGLKDFSQSVLFKTDLNKEFLRSITGKLLEFYPSARTTLKGIDLMEDCYKVFYDCFKEGVIKIGHTEFLPDIERTYKDENIEWYYSSDLDLSDAKKIIGRKIIKIQAEEYTLRLTLDDNTTIYIQGSRYGDGSLGVELIDNKTS